MESKLPLERELEPVFLQKFPPFSEPVKEFVVQYGPYFILILSVLGLMGLFTAFGIMGAISGMGSVSTEFGISFYLNVALGVFVLIMYLMAFSPLRARKRSGWNLLYYALLIGLLSNIVQLNIFVALVSGVLGFWVLFQIREKYIG
jgi:hypothetical protein